MEKTLQKVVWAEGILLGQQHFQQWDLYWEKQQQWRLEIVSPFAWGIKSLLIDAEALRNGKFRLKKVQGILSSGQFVNYDDSDAEPLSCEISSQTGELIDIFLCLPLNTNVDGITGYENDKHVSAWRAKYRETADCYDVNRKREVLFGQLQLILLANQNSLAAFDYVKIAVVKKSGRGDYQLVDDFVPPILAIRASEFLENLLSRWLELIGAAIRLLHNNRHQVKHSLANYTQHEFESFTLLQILSQIFPCLQHWQRSTVHPRQLYLTILELIAKLGSFSQDFSLDSLPEYQHTDLAITYTQLDVLLQRLLNAAMPTNLVHLILHRASDSLYIVENINSLLFSKTEFFIAAFFPAAEIEWITQFAKQIKVGSVQAIDSIVTSALPGVRVIHKQRPPNKLTIKTGYEYFYLEPTGYFWEQIVTEKNLAIFVPNNFVTATIELITVQK